MAIDERAFSKHKVQERTHLVKHPAARSNNAIAIKDEVTRPTRIHISSFAVSNRRTSETKNKNASHCPLFDTLAHDLNRYWRSRVSSVSMLQLIAEKSSVMKID